MIIGESAYGWMRTLALLSSVEFEYGRHKNGCHNLDLQLSYVKSKITAWHFVKLQSLLAVVVN